MSQPILEVGIGADLSPFEKAIGELRQEIRQLGTSIGAAGQQATGGYTRAMGQAGKTTDDLSGFIRTQRAESRQQNYLFRESQNAIGSVTFAIMGLSTATGDQSKSMQTLNKGLVTGYSLYQGLSFAAAGLGIATGGTTTAVIALLAVGASLFVFLDNSAEKAKKAADAQKDYAERIKDSFEGLTPQRTQSELTVEKAIVANAKARLKQLEADRSWGKVTEDNRDSLDKSIVAERAAIDVHEKNIKALEDRATAQAQVLAVEKREADGSLIANQELKIKNLKSEIQNASNLVTIREKTLELENAEHNLAVMKKGALSDLEARLGMERLITENLRERMLMELEAATRNPEPTTFGARFEWEGMMKTPRLGKIQPPQIEKRDWKNPEIGKIIDDALQAKSALEKYTESIQAMSDQWMMSSAAATIGFDNMLSGFRNMATQMIAGFIAIGVAAAVKDALVSVPFPFNVIIAGTAGAAAASLFSALVPKFGQGAMVYGPMLAMVGDNPNASSDPEVIAPFSKLQTLMEPQKHRIEIVGRIRNRDLYLVYNGYLSNLNRIDA